MGEIKIKDGSFIINGQAEIIHAAEFHYFRLPQSEWESRLKLLKDTGFNTLATYIPWLWHEIKEGEFDFTGKTHPMRDLTRFLDMASELGLWIIARPGPYIMAETINEGIPPWVFTTYPELSVIDQTGHPQSYLSYLHPRSQTLIKAWYKAVFSVLVPRQIDRGGMIIMIQLDNEIGMIHWVRNMIDLNPDNLVRFTHDLQTSQDCDVSTTWVAAALCEPDKDNGSFIMKAYRRYFREVIRNYAQGLWDCAKENGMTVLPVINIHGFGDQGRSFPIGLSQLLKAIRIEGMVCATDVYPLHIGEDNFHQLLMVNEMTRALQNKDQALFSIEFEAGGHGDFAGNQSSMTDLHTRLCLSSGMKAINHYLFMDGENFPEISPNKRHEWGHPIRKDGTFRSHYYRYPKLTSMMKAYGQALVKAMPIYETAVGFLINDYSTEVHNAFTMPADETVRQFRNVIHFDGIGRFLALEHLNFKAIEIESEILDVKITPTLWMMLHDECPVSVQKKLVGYVEAGGRLIIMGHIPVHDDTLSQCTILKEALGITQIIDPQTDKIDAFGYTDIPVGLLQCVEGEFDTVFALSKGSLSAGFTKTIKNGKVCFLGAALSTNTLDDLDVYRKISDLMGLKSSLDTFDWIDGRVLKGPLGNFLCLANYQDDPWADTVSLKGKTLFGGRPIELAARSGLILPLNLLLLEGLNIIYSTVELRQTELTKNRIVLHFSGNGYVKIESNIYQVEESDEVEVNLKDLSMKGTTLNLIRKG